MTRIPSVDAEQARFLANELRGVGRRRPVRIGRARRRLQDRQARISIEMTIPRSVAIAENYLLLAITRVIKPSLLSAVPPPIPADADTKTLRNSARNFVTLTGLWNSRLGVDLTSIPAWSDFDEFRDLRHVLVHRLGSWQPGIDSPHPKLATRLSRVATNPDAYRGEVPVGIGELQDSIDAVLSLVADADSKLPVEPRPVSNGTTGDRAVPRRL